MAGTTNIPLTSLAPGTYDFGPASLADGDRMATLSVDRTVAGGFNSQPATTQAEIGVYQSNDSGATWFLLASATMEGGSFTDRHTGQPYTQSSVTVPLQPGTGRQGKAHIIISGATVAVQGSLVIT